MLVVTAVMALILEVLLSTGPHISGASAVLPDGRAFPVVISAEDLDSGLAAVRISPRLSEGAFWSFGDAFQRGLLYRCVDGSAPRFAAGRLSCGDSASRLVPDVSLPVDPAEHPDSNVPPVVPRGEAVYQKPHFLSPWVLPCASALLVLVLLSWWLARRARGLPHPEAEPATRSFDRAAWIAVGLTTALGLGLRLYGLGFEPFEQNEFTYYMSGMGHDSLVGVLLDVNGLAQTHPPLPHLLLRAFRLFGSDEVVARLPSALAGVASIPLVFLLGWRLYGGRLRPAIIAALFAAVAPVHVWYSQDVSPYALTTLFAIVVLLSVERVLADAASRLAWWGTIAGTWGLVYTHYYGVHLSIACYLLLAARVVRLRRDRPDGGWRALGLRVLSSGFAIVAGVVPWIPAFFQGYSWSRSHSTAYQRLAGVYHPTTDHAFDALDTLRLFAGVPLGWRFAALALLGVALLWPRLPTLGPWKRWLLWLPLLWFLPFELLNRATFLAGLYGGWYFGIRYFLFLFPVVWLLMGAWADAAFAKDAPRAQSVTTLAVLVGFCALGAFYSVQLLLRSDKPDVATAAASVTRHLADGDAVIVGPAAFYQHPFHYYATDSSARAELRINHLMQTPAWHRLESGGFWVGLLSDIFEPYPRTLQSAHIRRVWVIDHSQHLFDRREFSDRPSAAIDRLFADGFRMTWRSEAAHDCSVRLFERIEGVPGPPARIHFGWSDGPWIRRFHPPWAYASPGRRVRPGSEVRFTLKPQERLTGLELRAGVLNPDSHAGPERRTPPVGALRVRVNGALVASLRLSEHFRVSPIALPSPVGGEVRIQFDLDRPPPGAPRPPEVVLDWLDLKRARR